MAKEKATGGEEKRQEEKIGAAAPVRVTEEGPPIRVLLIDDEPSLLEVTHIYLEKDARMQVAAVRTGHEALALLEREPFDVVVTDHILSDMEGLDILRKMRELGNITPFIIFTGLGREEVAVEALNSGAEFYLQKGGDPKAQFALLTSSIRQAVSRKRSERALRESERRYRDVVEDQTEFISRFLPDGTHVFVNGAYCRYFRKSREEILGSIFRPEIPKEDRQRVTAFFASLTPQNPIGLIEHRIRMPDGSIRWQRWSDRAIFDERGTIVEYQSVGRDITDVKEAERALRESERRLQAIVMGSPIAMFVIDRTHRVISWNHALEEYSGIRREDIVGTSDQWKAFYGQERPCMADLLVDEAYDQIKQWYAGKCARSHLVDGAYEATDFFPRIKGGKWLFFTAAPIRDGEGRMIGAIETLEDITERKQAEEALRESEALFHSLIDHLPEAALILDWDGTILFGNPAAAQLVGLASPEQGVGKNVLEFVAEESKAEVRQNLTLVQQGTERFLRDYQIFTISGESRWVQGIGLKISYHGRDVDLVTLRDITEKREAEEEVRASETLYRTIVETTGTATAILDEKGTIVLANAESERLFGYSLKEVVGTIPWTRFVPKHELPRLSQFWQEMQENPARSQLRYEAELTDRWGNQKFGIINATLIPGTHHVVVSIADITPLRQAELAITASEEKFRNLFHNAQDAIYLASVAPDQQVGKFLEVNDTMCRMVGYSREELLHMSPRGLDAPEVRHLQKTAAEELQGRGHITFETQYVSSQGTKVPVEVSSHLFTLHGEQVILSIARDITERKVNQEVERKAFEQIEKNINQLSILNDHLRNPLSVIVALADLEGGPAMEKILQQTTAINNIITQLDIGWLESEKIREFMHKHYGVGKGIEQAYPPKM